MTMAAAADMERVDPRWRRRPGRQPPSLEVLLEASPQAGALGQSTLEGDGPSTYRRRRGTDRGRAVDEFAHLGAVINGR